MAETFQRRDHVLYCEDVPLPDIVAQWGTPLYVYSATAIRRRFAELDEALAEVPHLIAYSVKANGNLGVLRLLGEMGAGADIVSGGELFRALAAGIPPERIVFSGVGKTVPELAAAIAHGFAAVDAALGASASPHRMPNFTGEGQQDAAGYNSGRLARLQRIKQERDPYGTIRSNKPVLDR